MNTIADRVRRGALILAVASMVAFPVKAQETRPFVVIVHTSNPVDALSSGDLSKIFLKRQVRWEHGQPITPVDLEESLALRERFNQNVHGRSTRAIAAHWQQQVFSGRDVPPPQRGTDADVIAFVAANPGAIGYVSARATLPAGVKAARVSG